MVHIILNMYHHNNKIHLGASTVKRIVVDQCLVLSECDSFLCTSFEFVKKKSIDILKHIDLQSKAKQFMMTKKFPRKSTHFRIQCK